MWGQPPSAVRRAQPGLEQQAPQQIPSKRKGVPLARLSRLYRSLRFTSTYYQNV
jgi:hypothetical protein